MVPREIEVEDFVGSAVMVGGKVVDTFRYSCKAS